MRSNFSLTKVPLLLVSSAGFAQLRAQRHPNHHPGTGTSRYSKITSRAGKHTSTDRSTRPAGNVSPAFFSAQKPLTNSSERFCYEPASVRCGTSMPVIVTSGNRMSNQAWLAIN